MADCTVQVRWAKNPTYEDVKQLYTCFEKAISEIEHNKVSLSFNFRCGTFRYTADNIEEFTELAFGEQDFELVALQFMGHLENRKNVRINYLTNLSVSASTKVQLEQFQERLGVDMIFGTEIEARANLEPGNFNHTAGVCNNVIPPADAQEAINAPISINGSGNVVNVVTGTMQGSNVEGGQIPGQLEKEHSGIKDFLSGVFQGVAGNAVWWILGLIGVALLGYFISDSTAVQYALFA